jgi:hypothetical protein
VSDDSDFQRAVLQSVANNALRSTLPFQEAVTNNHNGTAFWYNHLIEDTPEREVFRQYLVTAADLTGFEAGHWTLREEVGRPSLSAPNLLATGFAGDWTHLPGLGVAVMPAGWLHEHAKRKGWHWNTQEITDGLAAEPADLAAIGAEAVPAVVVGHDVGPENHERLQTMVTGAVARDDAGRLRWDRRMPEGCAGAPLFVGILRSAEQFKLVCAGVVLPGEGGNEIAPFDRIRSAVAAIPAPPAPRKWWRRRG